MGFKSRQKNSPSTYPSTHGTNGWQKYHGAVLPDVENSINILLGLNTNFSEPLPCHIPPMDDFSCGSNIFISKVKMHLFLRAISLNVANIFVDCTGDIRVDWNGLWQASWSSSKIGGFFEGLCWFWYTCNGLPSFTNPVSISTFGEFFWEGGNAVHYVSSAWEIWDQSYHIIKMQNCLNIGTWSLCDWNLFVPTLVIDIYRNSPLLLLCFL